MIALIEQQKTSIVEACRKFGVQRLEVFGSAARGDFDAQNSDLDFIAKFIPPLHPGVADRFFGLAAEALARFTHGKTVEGLKADEILQAAVERKLEIIGEAFVQLRTEDAATAEKFPELRQIVGMPNRLVHGYDQLDLDVLWDATISHVPKLLKKVETLLE